MDLETTGITVILAIIYAIAGIGVTKLLAKARDEPIHPVPLLLWPIILLFYAFESDD